ncbi:hypothetical protein [Streptomyces sp. NPDC056938]|uniref:hypothetical protein n=1 Tax=unclassified Streptomyces TaxID=2593676 RepID=UPI003635C438
MSSEEAKENMISCGLWPISEFKNTQIKWLCVCMTCGDYVTPRYNNVVNKGAGGCKSCGTKKRANSQRLDPVAAKERMIEKRLWPVSEFPSTLTPWLCVCMICGEFVTPTYASVVTQGQGGCKYCAIAAKTTDADEAKYRMIERGVWPVKEFKNTSTPWLSVCMVCGSFVKPTYNSVVHRGNGGCWSCGRKDVDPVKAKAVMIAHDLWPIADFPGTSAPWPCVCMKCGESVKPRYAGTAYRGSRCKFCSKKAVNPETAMTNMIERSYWPLADFPGTRTPWLCACMECGEFVSPRYSSIVNSGQGGCSNCATSGFREDEPALIYLVVHYAMQVSKVGICNLDTGRIDKHRRNGWVLHETYQFDLGVYARAAEKATVALWRARGDGWQQALLSAEEKYDGFTETVSLIRTDGSLTSPDVLWTDVLTSIKDLGL